MRQAIVWTNDGYFTDKYMWPGDNIMSIMMEHTV